MFKTAEREKERTKGGERKEYKIKITRVKRREIFPLIYIFHYSDLQGISFHMPV